jgi:hypothetical protein
MKPELRSKKLLGITRSKAKMFEYDVPETHHIQITQNPSNLFALAIALLGDLAAESNEDVPNTEVVAALKAELLFSANFFDAYVSGHFDPKLDPYLHLVGAASFYLADLPGSAYVLANAISKDCPNLGGGGLEDILHWLLRADTTFYWEDLPEPFAAITNRLSANLYSFFQNGRAQEKILELLDKLRKTIYDSSTPRQLLLCDVLGAVARKKILNSTWESIPLYSGIDREQWRPILQRQGFLRELWPAQHLLGKGNLLKGESAIVQMPTSAGKTRSTELLIRSAFLQNRTNLVVVVAPFRALCHEITDSLTSAFENDPINVQEISDSLQLDFSLEELLGGLRIIVLTPEKLLYILRQEPSLAEKVGVAIFDEGHQFDSGTRGVNYELLLTSLRSMLPSGSQKILISAVISNAEAIGLWLNGNQNVISGANLHPTSRAIGFVSWQRSIGQINFVSQHNINDDEFFVPRLISATTLDRLPRERVDRVFPDKSKPTAVGKDIALYLGLKLVSKGAVAIFCGTKDVVTGILESVVDKYRRGFPIDPSALVVDSQECKLLASLVQSNLGDSPAASSAELGVFAHHGNTPHGIRLAVEHAMRAGKIKFVVCTSTLAQGVNLPVRYLIVTSIYQGKEKIKVRDFHNLIGRAGRSGMHTEGSIILADPNVYDGKSDRDERWRWHQVRNMFDPNKSEPCLSNILSIFNPISSDDKNSHIIWPTMEFVKDYLKDPTTISDFVVAFVRKNQEHKYSVAEVKKQIGWKVHLISAIESFLMANSDGSAIDYEVLASNTLAYHIADDAKKLEIVELFRLLSENIQERVPGIEAQKSYGRTLFGVNDAQYIYTWLENNIDALVEDPEGTDFIDLTWDLISRYIQSKSFVNYSKPELLPVLAKQWISGNPFSDLLDHSLEFSAFYMWGKKTRALKVEHMVDMCENGFSYDAGLAIGALLEFVNTHDRRDDNDLHDRLALFQKQLKYGLFTQGAIAVYELGFADRVVAQDLVSAFSLHDKTKKKILRLLKSNKEDAQTVMEAYPMYYKEKMSRLLEK